MFIVLLEGYAMLYSKNKNKGFTLVEVVVVVVVLVVLAGILVPSFSKYISENKFAEKAEEELDNIFQSAQAVFYRLYAEGSHSEDGKCIITGENQNTSQYNNKYNTNILDKDIIRELINDGYLVISDNHLKCKSEYIYLENVILEKIIGSDL